MKKQVTKKQCKNLALNFTSRGCFKTNHYTHYMFARNNGFLDEICSHMIQNYRPKWSISKIIKIAKNCKTYNEFMLKENLAFNAAMRYKLIPKIKKILNHPNYTFEEHKEICRKEALKYTYRVDFQKGSPQLYNFAHRHNFLNEINKHMPIRNEKKMDKTISNSNCKNLFRL